MLASITPRQLVLASLAVWCACVGLVWWMAGPLGSDEAAYALLANGDGDGWLYRPIGFVAFARLGLFLGDSELALRLPSAVIACGLIPAVFAVGSRLGPWVGAGAAAVIAGTHTFVLRGPTLLTDVPSTIFMLAAIAIVIIELERGGGPSYRLAAVAPVLAASFYVRYGSAPTIAIVIVAACAVWRRAIFERPGPVLVTAGLFVALLVPFFVYSHQMTGSVTGILTLASEVAGRKYIGHGLVIYLAYAPYLYHGVLATPVVLVGLASVARPPPQRRCARFLALVAIGQLLAISLVSHASARFLFVAIVLLVALGVDAIARMIAARSERRTLAIRIAAWTILLAWVGMLVATVPILDSQRRGLAGLVISAHAIRADAAGRPCTVIARATPQIMWYSGCASIKPGRGIEELPPLPAGYRVYVASVPRRSIDADKVAALAGAEAVPLAPGAWFLRMR